MKRFILSIVLLGVLCAAPILVQGEGGNKGKVEIGQANFGDSKVNLGEMEIEEFEEGGGTSSLKR